MWAQLDALLSREFRHESGLPLRISAACVDCGFLTDEVLAFTRTRFGRHVYAVKGLNSGWSKPIWPRKPIYTSKQLPMFLISVDEAKAWFARRLILTEPGPGACHFPLGRTLDYFRMLTAENLVRRYRAGRAVLEWSNTRRERNEALDCKVYEIAALHSLLMSGLNVDQHSEQFQAMLAPAPPNGPTTPPPTVYRRGTIELAGDKPPVPGEDGVRFCHAGHLLQSFESESLADLSQRASLRVRQTQPWWQVRPNNTVLRSQVLVLEEQFLVHQPVTYASRRAH